MLCERGGVVFGHVQTVNKLMLIMLKVLFKGMLIWAMLKKY